MAASKAVQATSEKKLLEYPPRNCYRLKVLKLFTSWGQTLQAAKTLHRDFLDPGRSNLCLSLLRFSEVLFSLPSLAPSLTRRRSLSFFVTGHLLVYLFELTIASSFLLFLPCSLRAALALTVLQ